jgi:predicted nucleotide-binding protein with TIR-like domain
MPRKRQTEPPEEPGVEPEVGIRLLKGQIEKGRELLSSRPLSRDAYGQWELLTRNYLEKAFGRGSPNVGSVVDVGKYGGFPGSAGEQWWENHRAESLTTQLTRLEGLGELLQTELQLRGGAAISGPGPAPIGHRIFLVHGHNQAVLQEVARFLERLDQDVIILREQPNRGRTIIEKFEDYSDVGFAVILLTPDDHGGPASSSAETQQPRARQNVILELGYFLGRLGRSRVCALYQEGVEIPSDYSGVLYVKLDPEGGWRLHLAKELKAAGLAVDMNKAL